MMFEKTVFVTRFCPWPSDTGALLYSAMMVDLAKSVSRDVSMVCAYHPRATPVTVEGLDIHASDAKKPSALRYMRSGLPYAAVPFDTPSMRALGKAAIEGADLVILDHIGAAWATDLGLAARARGARLVYIAHNVETDTRRSAIGAGGLRALFARFDARRVARFETALLGQADGVICISDHDRKRFAQMNAAAHVSVVNPVHPSPPSMVALEPSIPRRVVLVGSFFWRAKQENLRRFLAARARVAAASTLRLRVVGAMPDAFKQEIRTAYPDVEITGAVDRIADHIAGCRIGVIPEEEGGGFKLKALDYAYGGLAIFGLDKGLVGLPLQNGVQMRAFSTMAALWQGLSDTIDDLAVLDQMRRSALDVFTQRSAATNLKKSFLDAVSKSGHS